MVYSCDTYFLCCQKSKQCVVLFFVVERWVVLDVNGVVKKIMNISVASFIFLVVGGGGGSGGRALDTAECRKVRNERPPYIRRLTFGMNR